MVDLPEKAVGPPTRTGLVCNVKVESNAATQKGAATAARLRFLTFSDGGALDHRPLTPGLHPVACLAIIVAMASSGRRSGIAMGLAWVVLAAACDLTGGGDGRHDHLGVVAPSAPGELVSPERPPPTGPAPISGDQPDAGSPDAGAPPPRDPSYEAMCRHYCKTLERTLVYACIGAGAPTADECVVLHAGTTAQCFELRCVPGRVTASLCSVQCGVAADKYDAVCGTTGDATAAAAPRPGGLFCSPEAEREDAACDSGCAVQPPSS